ncbi:transcription initiation factor IID, 18kD subunit-domain-containing protein, partial [Schizophyllum fasciatum]
PATTTTPATTAQPATPAATTPATPYQTQAYQTSTAYQTPATYTPSTYTPSTYQSPSAQTYQTPATYQTPTTYQTQATYSYTPSQSTTYTPQYAAQPQTVPRSTTFTNYTPSYVRESGGGIGRGGRGKQSNLRGLFNKELRNLMYGFGDDRNPSSDTVNVLEEILIEYITDVCQTAASSSKKARLSLDDLRKALSRPADAKKLARMEELLFMQEEIKRARAQFESTDMEK